MTDDMHDLDVLFCPAYETTICSVTGLLRVLHLGAYSYRLSSITAFCTKMSV
jgi:hypothetical protein